MANGQQFLIILPSGATSERPVEGLVWKDFTDTVLGGGTKIVDSFPTSESLSACYRITIYNTAQQKARSFNLDLTHNYSSTFDQLYAKRGSTLNIEVSTRVSSGSVEVEIVNNETYDLSVDIMKLPQPQS